EQTPMHLRVERLDAPVHHLWEARQVRDIADLRSGFAQLGRSPAGRDDLDAMLCQASGKLIEPALVRKRNQRSANGYEVSHRGLSCLACTSELPANFAAERRNLADYNQLGRVVGPPA